MGLPHASVLRLSLMYNNYRHSLGKTAFQDGRAFARTIRQGCGVGILKPQDDAQEIQIRHSCHSADTDCVDGVFAHELIKK